MDRSASVRSALAFALPAAVVLLPIPSGIIYGLLALTQPARRTMPGGLAGLVLAVSFLTSAVLSGRGLGVVGVAAVFLLVLVMIWLLFTRLEKTDAVPLVLGWLALLGVNLVFAMFQIHILGKGRASGLFVHPNVLGAVAAPLALMFLPRKGLEPLGSWRFVGAGIAVIVLAYCASRGAFLGLLLGALVAATVQVFTSRRTATRPHRPPWRMLGAVLIALAAVVIGLYVPASPLFGRLQALDSVGDPLGRTLLWSAAVELIAHRPLLGYGPMAWTEFVGVVEPIVRPVTTAHSHNLFLEVALWAGLLGLGALSWATVSLVHALWTGRLKAEGWSAAGIGAVVAMATVSVFDAAGTFLQVLIIWVLVLGLSLTMSQQHTTTEHGIDVLDD